MESRLHGYHRTIKVEKLKLQSGHTTLTNLRIPVFSTQFQKRPQNRLRPDYNFGNWTNITGSTGQREKGKIARKNYTIIRFLKVAVSRINGVAT